MSKRTGLGQNFFIDEFNVSGDIGVLDEVSAPTDPLKVTGIDKRAYERRHGLHDGMMSFTSFFNDATGQVHDALSTLPSVDVISSLLIGTALGDPAASIIGKQVNYNGSRDEEGNLTFKSEVLGNGFAIEWGHNLTAENSVGFFTSSGAEDCPGFDDGAGAATDFGLQVYFHVLSLAGGTITLTIQDSDDDGSDPYATVTGATSGSLNAVGGVRAQTSRTENVKEWLRVAATGTYTSATFVVIAVRNLTSVVF